MQLFRERLNLAIDKLIGPYCLNELEGKGIDKRNEFEVKNTRR